MATDYKTLNGRAVGTIYCAGARPGRVLGFQLPPGKTVADLARQLKRVKTEHWKSISGKPETVLTKVDVYRQYGMGYVVYDGTDGERYKKSSQGRWFIRYFLPSKDK